MTDKSLELITAEAVDQTKTVFIHCCSQFVALFKHCFFAFSALTLLVGQQAVPEKGP